MRGAILEVRTEKLVVLRSFSRPRVNNDSPYSKSLLRTIKYRPFNSKEEACQWVASFVDWDNNQNRHSEIKFVKTQQRHNSVPIANCKKRVIVYEQAPHFYPRG